MQNVMWVVLGTVIGGAVAWLVARASSAKTAERLRGVEVQAMGLIKELSAERAIGLQLRAEAERAKATLESERKSFEEQKGLLAEKEKEFKESFAALAADALQRNNIDFLQLAKTKLEGQQSDATKELELKKQAVESLVNPLSETLRQLQKQVAEVSGGQKDLKTETSRLVTALRTPVHRGRWGEVQLKRVVELAGMVDRCDFHEQLSFTTDEGAKQRPDMTIHLQNGREIVVDSKVAFDAFYDAMSTEDEALRAAKLKQHAAQVKAHLTKLSSKAYWQQLD
jgi:DNA recombination protein RmuC